MSETAEQLSVDDIDALPVTEQALPKSKYDRSIIEGPLSGAVWKLAWPTMLSNFFGGMQGLVDHIFVGNLVGHTANAAIGVSFQLILVIIVFISSIFTGMGILVARFAGAAEPDKVNRVVYQAFLATAVIAIFFIAPVGYIASPFLLDLVNAEAAVKAEALPYLRISFVFSIGLMLFFLLSVALRSVGDARTPMILGIVMTVLNIVLNMILIGGFWIIPGFGTAGAAIGSAIASCTIPFYVIWRIWSGKTILELKQTEGYGFDWKIIRELFRFGLPAGFQGVAMNVGGVMMLGFVGSLAQSAAAQAAYAVAYTQLFSLVSWTAFGLMGAAAAVAGQNLGAGQPDRAAAAVHTAAVFGLFVAVFVGLFYFFFPENMLAVFGMESPEVVAIGKDFLRVLAFSGIFVSIALTYTGGLQGTGDTKSPLYISIISQVIIPLGICFVLQQMGILQPLYIWLAILAGHITRGTLSFLRFNQGKWRDVKINI